MAMAGASGCGDDTCVVFSTSTETLEWTVTLAVTGSTSIGTLEAEVFVEPCSGVCDCHEFCGCGDCDCFASFSSARSELDCEPLVDATFRGSLDEDGTAHIALAAEAPIGGPAEILKCDFASASEPSPSDFRVVVNGAGPSAQRSAKLPVVVVTDISRR